MPFQPKRSLLPFTIISEMSGKACQPYFPRVVGPVYMHWDRYWRAPQGTSATSHTDAKDIGLLSILEINMEFIEAAHVPLGAK